MTRPAEIRKAREEKASPKNPVSVPTTCLLPFPTLPLAQLPSLSPGLGFSLWRHVRGKTCQSTQQPPSLPPPQVMWEHLLTDALIGAVFYKVRNRQRV